MALTIRRQSRRALGVIVALSLLVLLFLNSSDFSSDSPQPNQLNPRYNNTGANAKNGPHRRIQDYHSPEYTGAAVATGEDTAKDLSRNTDDVIPKDHKEVSASPQTQLESIHQKQRNPDEDDLSKTHNKSSEDVVQNHNEVKAGPQEQGIAVEKRTGGTKSTKPTNEVGAIAEPLKAEITVEKPLSPKPTKSNTDALIKEKENPSDKTPTNLDKTTLPKTTPQPDSSGLLVNYTPKNETRLLLEATKQNLIHSILSRQREVLAEAMEGYNFHPKLKVRSADELILERGGRPVRSIVITTWRSGSTFLGDVLQSHPATYYHYEPLLDFDIKQVRYGQPAELAIKNLKHLLTCNYSDMEHYLEYGTTHPWLFFHNTRLWNYCTSFPNLCWDPDFLSPFCSLFPFQSLKTVRLRLNLTREFLMDKNLGVQVLLLVRDPRGTIQSRKHRDWCPGNPDCEDPAKLCSDLVSDYNTALDFRRRFPHSFRVIRYEDMSFDAYNMTKELFDFFHLSYHPQVQKFLDTHTKTKIGGVSSTFRNSKTAPVHWKSDLEWQEVNDIQKVCSKALKLWGYEIATDEKHLRSFNPIGIFKFR